MSIQYSGQDAAFSDVVGVDEAERLLEWLQSNPTARLNLSACTHLHPANLQVLMAARATVSAWPRDPDLAAWLRSALSIPANP